MFCVTASHCDVVSSLCSQCSMLYISTHTILEPTENHTSNARVPSTNIMFLDWMNPVSEMLFWKMKWTVFLNKDREMDNVQKHNICTNVPLPQTFISYLEFPSFFHWEKFVEGRDTHVCHHWTCVSASLRWNSICVTFQRTYRECLEERRRQLFGATIYFEVSYILNEQC
jgi:hypothetical protein